MNIYIDADACPVVVKEIVVKAAERTGTLATFVANQYVKLPPSKHAKCLVVEAGFDVADQRIADMVEENDIVITADIPLAHDAIVKGAHVIHPRGEKFTESNIKQKLVMRDFMDTMRASGVQTGGQNKYSERDKQNFANQLDRLLAKK